MKAVGIVLAFVAGLLSVWPSAARAAELRTYVDAALEWNSNPFGRNKGSEIDSFVLLPGLRVELFNREGRLTYDLDARANYVVYLSNGNPFGWAVIGLGVWGAVTLLAYRRQILEDA